MTVCISITILNLHNMKLLICILLFLLPLISFSNIIGKLLNNNNEPIPYANIVVKNTTIGVVSNKEGVFNINIPLLHQNSSLIFSSLGYKTKTIAINQLKKLKYNKIVLETAIINLNEVSVKVKATNAAIIVQKAFDNYYNNFPTKPFIGKAFLRHTERTKTKYKWLIDAAIEVYDPGYDKHPKNIKLNIREVKQTIDSRSIDTTRWYTMYWHHINNISLRKRIKKETILKGIDPTKIQKAIEYNDNRKSNPITLFSGKVNVIRQYKQKDAIFDKKILKKHNFKIDTVLTLNGNDIYKIKITPKSPLAKLNKHYEDFVFPVGWIYIRAKDYAIFELQYSLFNSKKCQWRTSDTGTKLHYSINIKYTEINNKMYPKVIILNSPKVNKPSTVFHNNREGEKIDPEDFYYERKEIIFTKYLTNNTKINQNLSKKWNSNLFSPRPFNLEFWKKYSSIVETKEQKELREKLEAEIGKKNNN